MSIISYAQNFEDVMLWRALGSVGNGCYIDIGAHDPLVDSVSLMFYERGWRGIHVEPTPPYAELLRQRRPDEIVIQAAVADKNGIMSFYEFPNTGLSTGNPEIAEKHINNGFGVREIVVPAVTLDEVFSHECGQEVHWLKIDVEGGEKQVLKGWIHSSLRPWVVLIESTAPLSKVETHKQWEPLILSKGYKFAYFDGLNRFYVADGHAELLSAFASGPNVFDDFTLNGTANAPLCATLNSRIRSLEDQGERERQKLGASEAEAARIAQDLAVQERVFSAQLHASQQQIEAVSQRLVARERELGEQLRERDREAIVSEQRNSAHVQRLEEQIKTAETRERERQTEFVRLEQTRANLELQLTEQLRIRQTEFVRLEQTCANLELQLTEQLRMERDANYQLQHELAVVHRALSWRLTAPFRAVAGWFYPARLPSKDSLVTGSLRSTPKVSNTGNGATSETMRISSNFSEHAIETDQINAAPALETLLAYQDRVFIDCAYLTLLRRSPDPSGRNYYLRRLRDGAPKVQILSEISESPEARLINAVVPGLNDAIKKYRRKHKLVRLPLFGQFLKLFFKR
jgi:FkbM family methyltransferase